MSLSISSICPLLFVLLEIIKSHIMFVGCTICHVAYCCWAFFPVSYCCYPSVCAVCRLWAWLVFLLHDACFRLLYCVSWFHVAIHCIALFPCFFYLCNLRLVTWPVLCVPQVAVHLVWILCRPGRLHWQFHGYLLSHLVLSEFLVYHALSQTAFLFSVLLSFGSPNYFCVTCVGIVHQVLDGGGHFKQCGAVDLSSFWYTIYGNVYCIWKYFDDPEWNMLQGNKFTVGISGQFLLSRNFHW